MDPNILPKLVSKCDHSELRNCVLTHICGNTELAAEEDTELAAGNTELAAAEENTELAAAQGDKESTANEGNGVCWKAGDEVSVWWPKHDEWFTGKIQRRMPASVEVYYAESDTFSIHRLRSTEIVAVASAKASAAPKATVASQATQPEFDWQPRDGVRVWWPKCGEWFTGQIERRMPASVEVYYSESDTFSIHKLRSTKIESIVADAEDAQLAEVTPVGTVEIVDNEAAPAANVDDIVTTTVDAALDGAIAEAAPSSEVNHAAAAIGAELLGGFVA